MIMSGLLFESALTAAEVHLEGRQTTAASTFEAGDHLVSPRFGYSHHGIYIGNDMVVHYSGFAREMQKGSIEIASLTEFANGNEIKVMVHANRKFSRPESVDRAFERLGEDWYNLLVNNCEHFVNWCIEGKHTSPQVNSAVRGVISVGARAYMTRNPAVERIVSSKIRQLGIGTVFNPVVGPSSIGTLAGPASSGLAKSIGAMATVSSSSSSVAGLVGGASTGAVAYAVGGGAATAVSGIVGTSAAVALAPVVLPAAIAVGVGVAIKEIWDWL